MTQREKRISRVINDIKDDWSEGDKRKLIDAIEYGDILSEAEDIAKTQTVAFNEMIDAIDEARATFNKPSGHSTGIKAIDSMTFGLRGGELIIIAGASSHGKTAMALNMATSLVENSLVKILFISMEMTPIEIFSRVDHIANNREMIRDNFIVQKELNVTAANIDSIIRKHDDCGVIFIDHLHMMAIQHQKGGKTSYEAVNECMAVVKRMALEHNKPVVLLSHVSKARSGENGFATAADLKDSSGIEQLSDFVIMINADKKDRRIKYLTLEKSRTRRTVGEGTTMRVDTDGLKILDQKDEVGYGSMPF